MKIDIDDSPHLESPGVTMTKVESDCVRDGNGCDMILRSRFSEYLHSAEPTDAGLLSLRSREWMACHVQIDKPRDGY
jgi:hypothetical protein